MVQSLNTSLTDAIEGVDGVGHLKLTVQAIIRGSLSSPSLLSGVGALDVMETEFIEGLCPDSKSQRCHKESVSSCSNTQLKTNSENPMEHVSIKGVGPTINEKADDVSPGH